MTKTQPGERAFSQANARTAATQTHENNKGIRPTMPLDIDLGKPKLDSIIRGAATIMQQEKGMNPKTHIMPGGQIKDFGRFISHTEKAPEKIIINIGSNNPTI